MANEEHLKILKQGAGVGALGQGDRWLSVEDTNRLKNVQRGAENQAALERAWPSNSSLPCTPMLMSPPDRRMAKSGVR